MKLKLKLAIHRFRVFVARHKKVIFTIVGLSVLGGLIFLTYTATRPDDPTNRTRPEVLVPEKPMEEPDVESPLTGLPVSAEQATRPITAIVIENSPDARPQSSLPEAGVVLEFIAEGGITRFLALYQENRPDPIGPVRSLRPYFNDWIMTFDASIAHVGGSVEALAEARSLGLRDLDQFANSGSYYRTTDRFAPHNVYTDFDKLDALNKALNYTSSDFVSLPRKNPQPLATAKATNISINISSFTYQTDYVWSKTTNTYKRSTAGVTDLDKETGKQLAPSVVVVMEADYTISGDGRYHYDLVGTGKVSVFQDGNVHVGSWTKNARDQQITLTSDAGNEIRLNPGQVWITAIRPSQEVQYSL